MLSRWPEFWDDDISTLLSHDANNLDLYETKDEVIVKANVAGVETDKVEITFEKGVLWIQAKKEEESSDNDEDKKHYSKASWNYSYKVAVPGMLDFNQEPTAEVENGVVTVVFKKAEASKPRKLTVKAKTK
jgi:HSP20 family protein